MWPVNYLEVTGALLWILCPEKSVVASECFGRLILRLSGLSVQVVECLNEPFLLSFHGPTSDSTE